MVYFINKNKKIEHLVDPSVYGKVDKNGIVFLRDIGLYAFKPAWGLPNDDVFDSLFYQALTVMPDQKINPNLLAKIHRIESIRSPGSPGQIGKKFLGFAISGEKKHQKNLQTIL